MKLNNYFCFLIACVSLGSLTFSGNNDAVNKNEILPLSAAEEQAKNSISTKDELLDFISKCSSDSFSENMTFELASNIDLGGMTIKPIPIFNGILKGNNFTISNFKVDPSSSGNEVGFVRILTQNAEILDLNLDYEMEVKDDDTACGGIVGTNFGVIKNCTFLGKLKGRHIVGGISGVNETNAKIIDCKNKGNIIGKIFDGGICGFNKGIIESSENNGIINDTRFSSSDELTLSNIGGIAGFNQAKIINCINRGHIGKKQLGTFVGGIAGTSIGQINNCSNYGIVKGDTNIGGIVGSYSEFTKQDNKPSFNDLVDLIKDIINKTNASYQNTDYTTYANVKTSSLTYCINLGLVSGESSVGGVAGYSANAINALDKNAFDVNNCINTAQIEATKSDLGGIVGHQQNGKLQECFNVGNIAGNSAENVGGIIGNSSGEIAYSFAINDMVGSKYVGGIAGYATNIHDCYSITKLGVKNNFNGAIAGAIDEINDNVYNNFYVNDDFYGIDNIDYKDKATKVKKEEIACKDELNLNLNSNYFSASEKIKAYPLITSFLNLDESLYNNKLLITTILDATKFGSYVNFLNEDGDIIKKIFVSYEDNLNPLDIPPVPEKEGYFSKWSEFDLNNIVNNLYIKPIYDQMITTIASSTGANPDILVEGKFHSSARVSVNFYDLIDVNFDPKYTFIKSFEVKIYDKDNDISFENIKYKLNISDKYEKPLIAIKENDGIKIIDSLIDGNYIVFNASDNTEYVLLDEKFVNWNNTNFKITIISSSCIAILLVSGVSFVIVKKVKTKHHKNIE